MSAVARKSGEAIEHLLPAGVEKTPVALSIVVPALNEKITVGEFVDWCKEGIAAAGVSAQILIVDSSTDETPAIAIAHGAEVLRVPKRGLGRAYIDAIPYIRGQWIVMGDADLTYDFRELIPFVEKFKSGAEFVMGSRFRGSIEDGAMPGLHRYFGTPLTTWILNRIYGSSYSDIHCGMRGITRDALGQIQLRSQSWEYASEMVLKAARLRLRTEEVPVKFYKDREGRFSHHRRRGWLSPWIAGWLNLKVMLVYTPDSFLMKPGVVLTILGTLLSTALSFGPLRVGAIGFDLHWMLLGVTCASLGYSSVQIAILARIMHGLRMGCADRLLKLVTYDRGMIASALLCLAGFILLVPLAINYVRQGFALSAFSHSGIYGLFLVIVGFQTFGFTLLSEMVQRVARRAE